MLAPATATTIVGVSAKLPEVDWSALARSVAKRAEDALYVGVGAGVLAVQRAQVRRREVAKALNARALAGREEATSLTDVLRQAAGDQLRSLDQGLAAAEERVDAVLDQVETQLPSPARDLLHQLRESGRAARDQFRSLVSPAPGQA